MLGLGEEVGRAQLRVGGLVGDDQHLAGAGRQVDAYAARHEQLRGRDPAVARADDLVDRPHRLGSVRERGDRLRAADRVDLVDPELSRRREQRRRRARRGHGDPLVTPASCAGTAAMTSEEG